MQTNSAHSRFIIYTTLFFIMGFLLAVSLSAAAETRYKPFILAKDAVQSDMATVTRSVKQKLTSNGFEIAGEYSPYAGSTILVITNDTLRQHATQSEFGAFGAIVRVTLTKTDSGIQVAWTNPTYMSHAYRMKSDLATVTSKLASTLGRTSEYGPENGLTKEELRDYQYKWLMPYFYDRLELASYKTYQSALAAVEAGLAKKAGGVSKVYRIDLPDKEETIIGVHMSGPKDNDCSGDKYIMGKIDFKKIKSTGHLPYEVVISKGNIYALYAEFRIAINFPDLSMVGSNSFASIMCAPEAILTALTKAAGGKIED